MMNYVSKLAGSIYRKARGVDYMVESRLDKLAKADTAVSLDSIHDTVCQGPSAQKKYANESTIIYENINVQ